jgi:hypothetical protein
VLAATKVARDPQWLRMRIDDDDGVDAIFVARPAVIFHRLAGSILTGRGHRTR